MPTPDDYDYATLMEPNLQYDDGRKQGQRAFIAKERRAIREATLGPLDPESSSESQPEALVAPPKPTGMQASKAAPRKLTSDELMLIAKLMEEQMNKQHAAMLAMPSATQGALDREPYYPDFGSK